MNKRRGMFAASLGIGLLASTVSSNAWAADATVVIGYSAALTGVLAVSDGEANKGIQLGVDEINSQGGIGGQRKIDYRVKDNRADVAQASILAQELVDGGANVLLGPCEATLSIAVCTIAQSAKIPCFSVCAATPSIVRDSGDFTFMNSPTENLQGAVLALYARKQGYQRAYVLLSSDVPYLENLPEYFAETFQKNGGQVLARGQFRMGQSDFSAEITNIRDLNPAPDVIMTAAWEPDFPSFLTQLRSAGIMTPVLGSNGIDSVTTTNLGPTAEGVVFTTSGFATPGSPMETFFKKYEAKFGQKTESGFAAQGYDLVQVVNASVLAAGTTAGPALRDAISNLVDVQGATTKITYKGTSGIGYRAAALVRVHNGKKELIEMALPPRENIPPVR